jgi:hypothetical protein
MVLDERSEIVEPGRSASASGVDSIAEPSDVNNVI